MSRARPCEPGALAQDIARWTSAPPWWAIPGLWLRKRSFRPVLTYRLYHAVRRLPSWIARPVGPALKLLHFVAEGTAGMDLPLGAVIGPGFQVQHGWGLVVNDRVHIGRHVTVLHGVTIGQNARGQTPVVEDEVAIGAGAVIIGGCRIGRGARVGAGCVVTRDVPPGAVVVGNPQRVIRTGAGGADGKEQAS